MRVSQIACSGLILFTLIFHPPIAVASDRDPWWGRDKQLHFAVSVGLANTAYLGASFLTPREIHRTIIAETVAFSAGIAKEVYDKFNHGDPSYRDLTWDLIGSTTGTVVAWLIDRYLF